MLRRDMSSSPPLGDPLPKVNKFVAESFTDNSNVRTIYAGALEDRLNRESRVFLLIGPAGSGKSSLIDFFCSHFYGATLEAGDRYHIANQKFNDTTPEKSIITYIFNDTIMDFRPIIIDTPGTGQHREAEELSRLLETWIQENSRLRIDLIGLVFSHTVRMTTAEENDLQKILDMFPQHLRSNFAIFLTGSDGSAMPEALLRRFNLQGTKTFKINASCLYQKRQSDAIHEHLRGTYWRMTVGNFTELFFHLRKLHPVTFSGDEAELPPFENTNRYSSGSSTVSTVIHKEPTIRKTEETLIRTFGHDGKVSTTTNKITMDNDRVTEERTIVHPPAPSYFSQLGKRNLPPPPLPPPPPPPGPPPPLPTSEPPKSAGLPTGLLEDIKSLRRADSNSEDDVIIVEYELPSPPEVVIMKKTPTPPGGNSSSSHQSSPPRLEEFPPPLTPTANRPYDLPPSEFYKSVTRDESGTTTRFSSLGTRVSVGSPYSSLDRRSVSPTNVTTTYSTVAYMNDDGPRSPDKLRTTVRVEEPVSTTPQKTYNPYERDQSKTPETPSTVVLRTPATPTLSQQIRHSYNPPETTRPIFDPYETLLRTQSTRHPPPESDVVRWIYNPQTRSHQSYNVGGGRNSRPSVRGSRESVVVKRESKSLETITRQPMETEPSYQASGYTITHPRSATSLNHLEYENVGPELVHSEDNYTFIDPLTKKPKPGPVNLPPTVGNGVSPVKTPRRETTIDFPMPPPFQRNDGARKSLRSPPGTQMDSVEVSPAGPIPARRTSAGRNGKDVGPRGSKHYPPPPVDPRDSPEYSIGTGVVLRESSGRNAPPRDLVSRELRDREDYLRQTKVEVQRQSYPNPPNKIYENMHPPLRYENMDQQQPGFHGGPPRQSQIGQGATPGSPGRNDFIIPQQMRENQEPIHVTVGMKPREVQATPIGHGASSLGQQNQNVPPPQYEAPPHLPPHGYRDQDYGDNWDGETTIMTQGQRQSTRREEGRSQGQRPPDLRIGGGATVANGRVNQENDPRSPPPPPYPNRQYPNTPDAGHLKTRRGGDDSDLEGGAIVREDRTLIHGGSSKGRRNGYYEDQGRYQKAGKGGKQITTTKTTTKTSKRGKGSGKGKGSAGKAKSSKKENKFHWCSFGTRKDCILNSLFFIVAPIFLLLVLIVVLVLIFTAGRSHNDRYYNSYINDNYNGYYNSSPSSNNPYLTVAFLCFTAILFSFADVF